MRALMVCGSFRRPARGRGHMLARPIARLDRAERAALGARGIGAELLHAMVVGIGDVDEAGVVHRDVVRELELTVAGAESTPAKQERAVAGELLDPAVVLVGYVDLAVAIDREEVRDVELPVACAVRAEAREIPAVPRELLHAMVAILRDEHVAA